MKDSLLLIMTPNMSLEKWDKAGFLTREMDLYQKICKKLQLKLVIYSYGRNEGKFIVDKSFITVLPMPNWIPSKIPFRVQNLIYHIISPLLFFRIFKTIKIAKTNQFAACYFGLFLKAIFRIPLVIRMGYYYTHFNPSTKLHRLAEKFAFKWCNLILVTSTEACKYIETTYQIAPDKIGFIYNSIDVNKFKPMDIPKVYDIIFVERLEKSKDIDLLVSFIRFTNLKVLVIGKGLLEPIMEQVILDRNNVTWLKKVDNTELPTLYNQSATYLILSKYEGNPKTLLEAMACGVPCIGVHTPGIRECIEHNFNGLFIEPKIEDISYSVKKVLEDKNLAKSLGFNGVKWIYNNCNMDKNIEKESQLFKMLSKHEN